MKLRQITFGEEAREELLEGCRILFETVAYTLGPGGRTVLIRDDNGKIHATKDGVSVAKQIHLEDDLQDIGAQILKQASMRTGDTAGDGTTSAVILAYDLIQEIFQNLGPEKNRVDIKTGLLLAASEAIQYLESITHKELTQENLSDIATLSANGDRDLGDMVGEMMYRIGQYGSVEIRESHMHSLKIEYASGYEMPSAPLSYAFVESGLEAHRLKLENVFVMIYHGTLSDADGIARIASQVTNSQATDRPCSFLLICDDIEAKALEYLIYVNNNTDGRVAAIRSPHNGPYRRAVLQDLEILLDARFIDAKDKTINLQSFNMSDLGFLDYVSIGKTDTVLSGFVESKEHTDRVEKRIAEILESVDHLGKDDHYTRKRYTERAAKLNGKLATILVGSPSQIEYGEKKDRLDDAICATRSALESGVVPGCGITYIKLAGMLNHPELMNESKSYGYHALKKSLGVIFDAVLTNANLDPSEFEVKLSDVQDPFATVDVRGAKVVNAIDSGILDPAKVIAEVIENAASVVGTLLTTEAVVDSTARENEDDDGMLEI